MKKMKKNSIIILMILLSAQLWAQTSSFNPWGSREKFALSPWLDGITGGLGFSLDIADVVLDKALGFGNLEYSGQTFDVLEVNPFDRFLMHSYVKVADKSADFIAVATILTPAVLFACPIEEWLTIGVMYAESLSWAFGLKEILKMSVGRVRPYMYFSGYPEEDVAEGDWNFSFPSGHTTYAFTVAAFSTYVFCKYFPDSAWRFAVGFGAYALASTTAFLRVYSGCHFATDVITGCAIGTLCGFLVPYLHTLFLPGEKNGEIRVGDQVAVRISPLRLDLFVRL